MEPVLTGVWGNPSSLHLEGVRAKQLLIHVHEVIAQQIGAHGDEIVCTSGATESINLAIFGVLKAGAMRGKHVVTVATEHVAVLNAIKMAGAEVTIVDVDDEGCVDAQAIVSAIRPDTVLVSVMMANNEIGVVHDVHAVGKAIEAWRKQGGSVYPLFHSDASQAPNYLEIDVVKLHVDLLTLSSPKVYGPKGVGALYVKRHIPFATVFGGGRQEGGRRPGTENIVGIVGFATALKESVEMRERESMRLVALRDVLIEGLLKIPGASVNGGRAQRLPNNVNVAFEGSPVGAMPEGVDGEELVLRLDAVGIAVSTGSACKGGAEPSHVLAALGCDEAKIRGSVRLTLGRGTTRGEIDVVVQKITELVSDSSVIARR